MKTYRSLFHGVLMGSTGIALLIASTALARVGVTSGTDGDPLGKPPAENERILRIGLDVQASEVITTHANDRAHLMFLDGTSVTVGPNARLTIDRFVYDPDKKTGELAMTATRGVLRLVGGKISKATPVTINTPSSTIGIRGGITIVDVQQASTTSTFVFGNNMTVRAGGQTQNVTRAGSTVTTIAGAPPGPPFLAKIATLGGQLGQLEGASGSVSGRSGTSTTANADAKATSSGFSTTNSNRTPGSLQSEQGSAGSATQQLANSELVATALTNRRTEQQPQPETQQRAPQPEVQTPPSPAPSPTRVIPTYGRYRIELAYVHFYPWTSAVLPAPGNHAFPATQESAPVANFFARQGVTPCTCDFMRWGWWSGYVPDGPHGAHNPNGQDRLNLATYVAGTLTSVADLNTLNRMGATATYTGHLVGNVKTHAGSYVAAGTYSNAWSFGPRTGNVNVTFDGASFSGVTNQPNATINAFSTPAPLGSTGVVGRNMTLNGSFANSPTDAAKGQMGNFTINGAAYKAGGTFAAQKP